MEKAPPLQEIRKWLKEYNPLGLFEHAHFTLDDIDPKPWSGHFNYLITVKDKKFVLRFKGPEWGSTEGVSDEYAILKGVERYAVGPHVYYFSEDFFGESVLFEEYLEGVVATSFSDAELFQYSGDIARLLVFINSIPIHTDTMPFRENMVSYAKDKEAWENRLKIIVQDERTQEWGEKIVQEIIPKGTRMLNAFEERLKRVLQNSGPSFIFVSAHAGHCLKGYDSFRFYNWEQIGYGDPSYSLAVFLASVSHRANFLEIKKTMLHAYHTKRTIEELDELIEQRLKEREISNLTWVLWAHTQKNIFEPVDVSERFERSKKAIEEF